MPGSHQTPPATRLVRCAIYARKSTEEGLAQPFNSLDAQRESAEAYILSQRHMGWMALERHYEDGGYTGANLERPALRALMEDIESDQVDCVVVYKVDRLSRSLLDFARLIGMFEEHGVPGIGHAAAEYDGLSGPVDAEYPAILCAVRTGTHRGTDAG